MRRLFVTLALLLATCPCFAGMGRQITKGATSQTTYVRIVDSTDGTPETGVVATTTGLDLEYVRLGAAAVDITPEVDLASASAAYSSGGIFHVGNGVYRFDIPDAAVATGVDQVSIQGTADGMVVLGVTHQLVELPLSNSSTFITVLTAGSPDFETGVQTALTNQGYTVARAPNLDNADASVSSRQPTIWSGPTATVDLSGTTISTGQTIGSVSGAVGSVTGAVGSVTGNVGGNVVGSVASVTGAVGSVTGNVGGNVVGSVASVATGGITSGSFAGDAITAAKLAPDVTTEIQSGLATASGLATTQATADSILVDTGTTLPGILGAPSVTIAADIAAVSGAYVSDSGTAQAGAAGTLTLRVGAVATDDYFNYQILTLTGGTGAGQARIISDYAGATKVATVNGNWATTPDATTTYTITAFGQIPGASAPTAEQIRQEMDTNSSRLTAIIADTNEIQVDWADGGRLDLLLDGRASQLSVDDLPTGAELTTALGTLNDVSVADVTGVFNTLGWTLARAGYQDKLDTSIPAGAPGTPTGLPTTDDVTINPVVNVNVVGGGPVEHEPVPDANKRKLSRRAGVIGMNRPWSQPANSTQWHSVDCEPILGGGKLLDAIAAPTVVGGDGKVSVLAYAVIGKEAKVRISTTVDAVVGTTATIQLLLTPSVGAQVPMDCEFEVK